MTRIAVTQTEYDKAREAFSNPPPGYECLRAPAPEPQLAAFIQEHQALHAIVGTAPYAGALYAALSTGGVIARFGVGHDGVNKDLATTHKLLCTNTPGVLDQSVAEYAIALLLAAARHIPQSAQATRQGQWQPILGTQLQGKQLTVIGAGSIGRLVGRIAAHGLNMRVVGCDPRPDHFDLLRREHGFADLTTDYERAVAAADFVTLHVPGGPATTHYIDAARLAAMPARAWLINTARGSVVDESALFDALAAGRLAGAALDVAEHEPYAPIVAAKDLRTLDNVILMPHAASSTYEACDAMAKRSLHNITLADSKQYDAMDLLNPQVLPSLENPK